MHFLSFSASTCITMSWRGRLLLPTAIRDEKPNIEQQKMSCTAANEQREKIKMQKKTKSYAWI